MLTMKPNSTANIIAKTYDATGQQDTHECTFTSNNDNMLLVQKTGPNTASLTAGGGQGEATLTVTTTDDTAYTHYELVKIDDRSIASISVDFA